MARSLQRTPGNQVFESSPCVALDRHDTPIMAEETGRCMAQIDDDHWLLPVGDLGHTGIVSGQPLSHQDDNTYVRSSSSTCRRCSVADVPKGRPQSAGIGARAGRTPLCHRARSHGGDELNRIVDGPIYGWPFASYGRTCGDVNGCTDEDLRNPLNQHLGPMTVGFLQDLHD